MRAEKMTWVQVGRYFKEHDTVLLTVGSTECHGRQLPLGTDTLIPTKILELLEDKTDWLIAPVIPYGACDYFAEFPGTISIGEDGLYMILSRVIDGYYRHGARHFAVLNGHGGNDGAINRIGYELRSRGALLTKLDWWTMVWDMNPDWTGGHAGGEETAGIMAVDPALVDREQIDDMNLRELGENFETATFMDLRYKGVKVAIPRMVTEITDNGWRGADHPKYATEEWGREMLKTCADYIADYLDEFKKLPTGKPNYAIEFLDKENR